MALFASERLGEEVASAKTMEHEFTELMAKFVMEAEAKEVSTVKVAKLKAKTKLRSRSSWEGSPHLIQVERQMLSEGTV